MECTFTFLKGVEGFQAAEIPCLGTFVLVFHFISVFCIAGGWFAFWSTCQPDLATVQRQSQASILLSGGG